MNERPKLRRGKSGLNVHLWVVPAAAALDHSRSFRSAPMNVRF
jgi:hypothetical protein